MSHKVLTKQATTSSAFRDDGGIPTNTTQHNIIKKVAKHKHTHTHNTRTTQQENKPQHLKH
jgi:hypothetical protein